jgi:hypothetical protein
LGKEIIGMKYLPFVNEYRNKQDLFYTGFMTVLKRLKTIKFEENKRHILQG